MNSEFQKNVGAYYTDQLVADFLVSWAIREPQDKVLDPSCGDGVFLVSAAKYLNASNGKQALNIFGIEIRPEAISATARNSVPSGNLISNDFFEIEPAELTYVDAVVGNPPFIRYQRFNGASRANALKVCRQVGVNLPRLSSSWALKSTLNHFTTTAPFGWRWKVGLSQKLFFHGHLSPVKNVPLKGLTSNMIQAKRVPLKPPYLVDCELNK